MESEGDDDSPLESEVFRGGHWPDPGDPPEGATAAMRSRYANVEFLVNRLRQYAYDYYSTNVDFAAGYGAGMRKASQVMVNWVKGKDNLWDR